MINRVKKHILGFVQGKGCSAEVEIARDPLQMGCKTLD